MVALGFAIATLIAGWYSLMAEIQEAKEQPVPVDVTIIKEEILKGDQIFILFSSILRNKNEFYNPDSFIPERWAKKSIQSQDLVFGVGPQKCPSKNITPVYYKTIIHYLLKSYKYKSAKPKLKSKELHFINPYNIKFYL